MEFKMKYKIRAKRKRVFIYLTSLIPLSMIWIYIPIMRGKILKRGAEPLLDSLDEHTDNWAVLDKVRLAD